MAEPILVNNLDLLDKCLKELFACTELAVDCEGINLCRTGRLCLVQLFPKGSDKVWVVDVTGLGPEAFDHTDEEGRSLRKALESPDIIKLFYDCRNDADALINLHGVVPAGIIDLQLAEVLVRRRRGFLRSRFVLGLSRAIREYLPLTHLAFQPLKEQGQALFAPERGGGYEVFEVRPLNDVLLRYAAQDVTVLGKLKEAFGELGRAGELAVETGSKKRIAESAKASYVPNGRHKALIDHGF